MSFAMLHESHWNMDRIWKSSLTDCRRNGLRFGYFGMKEGSKERRNHWDSLGIEENEVIVRDVDIADERHGIFVEERIGGVEAKDVELTLMDDANCDNMEKRFYSSTR